MFPKLSEKAWDEIGLQSWGDYDGDVYAFMSLFDLEKYPIAPEDLLSFVEHYPGMKRNFDYAVGHGIEYIYITENHFGGAVYFNCYMGDISKLENSVESIIKRIARVIDRNEILIIGEIHGWWEKGEAQ